MKKLYLLFLLMLTGAASFAQVTITQANMPFAGDTMRRTRAQTAGIAYQPTGPNYFWDYTNLRAQSQDLKSYLSLAQTNPLYALFFANQPFNPNRSNVAATSNIQILNLPGLTVANPYDFFYRSATVYKQTGFGGEIGGIPIPNAFSKHDTIYKLPLTYPDQDTALSSYALAIPTVFTYGTNQTRINNVDGWGVIATPYGSYNVIRVKTQLSGNDTIYIDQFNFGFSFARPVTTEYKWLTDSVEKIPVLQVNTQTFFGFEIVSGIWFRDDYITVFPINVASTYCSGVTYALDYTAEGTFNNGGPGGANIFRAQLSDATGSFATPVNIGNITATESGVMNITIPANTPPGTGYRIRVIGTNLATVGPDNGFAITIAPGPISTVTASNSGTICGGDSVVMTATYDASYTYQWQLNGTDISGATGLTYTTTTAGVYHVITSNSCGGVTSNNITVTVNPAAIASFTSGALGICPGDSTLLTANLISGYTYQWLWNGIEIPNATGTTYFALYTGDYTLAISGICGNDTSAVSTLNVNAPPSGSISSTGALTFCDGDSVLFNAVTDSSYTYQWQLNGADISGANSDSYYANQTGSYNVVVSNGCGDSASNVIDVLVNALPVADFTSSVSSFCAGDSILLSATAGATFSYQWQFNGVDISGANADSYYAAQAGDYTLVVSTPSCGNATSSITTLTVNPLPDASFTAAASAVCNGDSSLLSAVVNGSFTYQWQFNGTDINGATSDSYYAAQAGDYTVVVSTTGCGSASSTAFTLTINPTPDATITAAAVEICAGDSSLLSAVVNPDFTYQWQFNGVDINGATGSEYYANAIGDYSVVVISSACGSAFSSIISLNVVAQPTAVITAVANVICAGDSTLLSVGNNPLYSYQWQLNTVDISAANSSDFYATAAGDYTVVVSSNCGTVTATSVNIAVIDPPVASISASGATVFCAGDSVVLSAITDPGYTYQWQLNGVDISGAVTDSYTVLQSGLYTAVVSNSCGNIVSNDITVSSNAYPDASFTAGASGICVGDSTLLSAIPDPNYTYQWQLDGVDIAGATDVLYYASVTGNYSLVVTSNPCGTATSSVTSLTVDSVPVSIITPATSTIFCAGDSVVMNGNVGTGYAYQWQYNGVDINGAITSDYTAYQPGIYNMLVTNGCGVVSSAFINVTVFALPDTAISVSGTTDLCPGDSVMISVPFSAGSSYQWIINGNTNAADTLNYVYASIAGDYQVEVNSLVGCGKEISSIVTVTINVLPAFTLASANPVCQGDSVLLDASTLPATLGYQWWFNGSPLPGANQQTLYASAGGDYQLQYWNSCDTIGSNIVTVTINPTPAQPVIGQVADTLTSTAAASYQWYLNGAIIPGAVSQTYIVNIDGNYSVVITDANGCTNESQAFVFNSSGIGENADAFMVNVVPNPFTSYLQVSLMVKENQAIEISLIAATGAEQTIYSNKKLSSGSHQLHLTTDEALAPGIYMIRIKQGDAIVYRKLIKQ